MEGRRNAIVAEEDSFSVLFLGPVMQPTELEEAVAETEGAQEGLCLVEMWAGC